MAKAPMTEIELIVEKTFQEEQFEPIRMAIRVCKPISSKEDFNKAMDELYFPMADKLEEYLEDWFARDEEEDDDDDIPF